MDYITLPQTCIFKPPMAQSIVLHGFNLYFQAQWIILHYNLVFSGSWRLNDPRRGFTHQESVVLWCASARGRSSSQRQRALISHGSNGGGDYVKLVIVFQICLLLYQISCTIMQLIFALLYSMANFSLENNSLWILNQVHGKWDMSGIMVQWNPIYLNHVGDVQLDKIIKGFIRLKVCFS